MRARVHAEHDLDLLLIEQPFHLIDGGICLALRIGVNRLHLVLAGHAAALVDEVDRDLRADRARHRASCRERPGQVVDDADPDRLLLGGHEFAVETKRSERGG